MKFYSGLPETRCGRGSTLKDTQEIREALPKLFKELGIKTILDAPCGDCNWISQIDLSGIDYTGIDNDRENLTTASRKMRGAFIHADIVEMDLPPANLLLCREFIQHIPNDDAVRFLSKVSQFDWLLITNYDNEHNSDIPKRGDFRKVNLTKAPFNFPPPTVAIADCEKTLGLWVAA